MGWITVKVMKRGSSGQTWPLEYCTVAGSVAGFFGGMTRDFKTDDRGIAEVSWESSKDLGCLYIKGHAEFAQEGTLNVVGNVKHGIKAGEYITLKNATINGAGYEYGYYFAEGTNDGRGSLMIFRVFWCNDPGAITHVNIQQTMPVAGQQAVRRV